MAVFIVTRCPEGVKSQALASGFAVRDTIGGPPGIARLQPGDCGTVVPPQNAASKSGLRAG
ncbi:MAG: hypothetical protein C4547_02325 [Phycisphaerales bacterium]|nr:MAG: hypothetical protein C4547_02325 [Phycisphaerales bacterium]